MNENRHDKRHFERGFLLCVITSW